VDGHRIVEIGTVELVNRSPTGKTSHRYLCLQRDIPADAHRGARTYFRVLGRQAVVWCAQIPIRRAWH
jgi:hypothetical protein